MKRVFADANLWIAITDVRDPYHAKARVAAESVGAAEFVTTTAVILELFNAFAGGGPALRQTAVRLYAALKDDPRTRVVELSTELLARAVALYAERGDKDWGLIDCVTFVTMADYGIDSALTYDRHFEQAGFVALLRA